MKDVGVTVDRFAIGFVLIETLIIHSDILITCGVMFIKLYFFVLLDYIILINGN